MAFALRWLRRLPEATQSQGPPDLFAVVGDEPYFLPHFLVHYRTLGVERFTLYLDRPSEATFDLLQSQPDVALLSSDIPFGQSLGHHRNGAHYRFHHLLRDQLTDQLFAGRWALTVDTDEFAVLPSGFGSLQDFCEELGRHGLVHCSAPMVDFYPERLNGREFDPRLSPFRGCPWFDRGPYYHWQAPALEPRLSRSGVRERICRRLADHWPEEWKAVVGANYTYAPPKCWKVPLIRHGYGVRRIMIHEATHTPSNDVALALAHFKYHPGIDAKVRQALERQEYYRGSLEYRILALTLQHMADESLVCEDSLRWEGPKSLEEAELLLMNRLSCTKRSPPAGESA